MGKAARWLGAAALAAALLPLALVQEGCQSTCTSNADCGGGNYCEMASGECLLTQPIGFCKPLPTSCPPVDQPLCGCDGKQYTNACEAAQAGISPANDGMCASTCGGASEVACTDETTYCHFMDGVCGAGSALGTCNPVPTTCAGAAPSPVCGCDRKTYASACEAQQAGTSVAAQGACACGGSGSGGGGTACEPGKFCNYAVGTCAQGNPSGTCTVLPATCDAFSNPVCGCDGTTYDNPCEAAKARTSIFAMGACPCGGPSGATCGSGAYCNLAMGACLGPYPTGTCEPKPTSCPGVSSPVCGCDGKTYDNACKAAKAGTAAALAGACPTAGMGTGGGGSMSPGSDAGDGG